MKDTYSVTVSGVQLSVQFEYEPGQQTHEINDPETFEILDAEIIQGSLIDLLDSHNRTSEIIDDIKEELRKQF